MYIYAKAACIHILFFFILCKIYGTFHLDEQNDAAEINRRSLTRRFIFDSNNTFTGWASWEQYAACSTTCIKGYENQTRACCDTGNNFFCYTIPWKNLTQYIGSCPVDGRWSSWSPFSMCDVTCGNGSQFRTRTCEYLDGLLHGSSCIGTNNQSQDCNQGTCPADGVWLQWGSWSACSVTCGDGTRDRHRDCYYQPEVPQTEPCLGATSEQIFCNNDTCPVDGVWFQWSSWSSCSVSCGGGTRDRRRACFYQLHVPQGQPCIGAISEQSVCNNDTCPEGIYQPRPGSRFQCQLEVDENNPFDYSMSADLYDVDLWAVTTQDISAIHEKGAKVICYFSAGSYDRHRPDAHLFQTSDIGNKMQGWDEKWIDIRSSNVKSIMASRMDLAKSKHCDGIEPDNVDGHEAGNANIGFSYNDQLVYNKWLADQAHSRGLSIGLKNDVEQISELHSYFDWALNEECHSYDGGRECMLYQPFLSEGKAVFNIEYVDSEHVSAQDQAKCKTQHPSGMSTQFKLMDVTSWAWHCPGQ